MVNVKVFVHATDAYSRAMTLPLQTYLSPFTKKAFSDFVVGGIVFPKHVFVLCYK